MAEITVAVDEDGANKLFDTSIAMIGPQTSSGSGTLGPFTAGYSVTGTLANGQIDLIAPSTIRIEDLRLNWNINLNFEIDLGMILPEFCIPRVCVDIPCVGRVCTPRICIDWPVISVPVSFGDFLKATVDLGLDINLSGGNWEVKGVVLGVQQLQFGATSVLLLAAIGAAATLVLLPIPFIGPFLAIGVNAILAVIAIAGVTGFLGPIITPFISGLTIPIYEQPQQYVVLSAESAVDPEVNIKIDDLSASVVNSIDEDELVLTADISP